MKMGMLYSSKLSFVNTKHHNWIYKSVIPFENDLFLQNIDQLSLFNSELTLQPVTFNLMQFSEVVKKSTKKALQHEGKHDFSKILRWQSF